jgi:SAM-dependent methyltransferase
MYLDISRLQSFYDKTLLGHLVCNELQRGLLQFWPSVQGQHILGYGYATPFLHSFLNASASTIAFMPAQQGVCAWPDKQESLSVLVQEKNWPLETNSVSRILLVHALENSEQPGALLDEAWRVLEPHGRIIFVVPNRVGLWARRDVTPFGFGRPYTLNQLENTLNRHRFERTAHKGALYFAPSHQSILLNISSITERIGRNLHLDFFGGVWIVEAIKSAFAPISPTLKAESSFAPRGRLGAPAHAKITPFTESSKCP